MITFIIIAIMLFIGGLICAAVGDIFDSEVLDVIGKLSVFLAITMFVIRLFLFLVYIIIKVNE